eukprot:4646782-Alexandrium_andersonii.AAC.1
MKSEDRRWTSATKLDPWPAEVLHPARPKCSSQSPASERHPEPALKKKPEATSVPAVLKVPARRYWPAA